MILHKMQTKNIEYNKQKFMIAWEKWQDPYSELVKNFNQDDEYDSSYNDNIPNNSEQNPKVSLLSTPNGVVPLTEQTTPGKLFNFWIGHCNFDLDNNILHIINKIDGVETLDIYTRYRMRVGIGKLFVPRNVMNSIAVAVNKYLSNKKNNEHNNEKVN